MKNNNGTCPKLMWRLFAAMGLVFLVLAALGGRCWGGAELICKPGSAPAKDIHASATITSSAATGRMLTCHEITITVAASDIDEHWTKDPSAWHDDFNDEMHYTWTVPIGVTNPGDTNELKWTPSEAGTYPFTVVVSDKPLCPEAHDPNVNVPVSVVVLDPHVVQYTGVASYPGSGNLHFDYTWQSSTGPLPADLQDLDQVRMWEKVTYPGGSPYQTVSPPFCSFFPNGFANPTIGPVPPAEAKVGHWTDDHASWGWQMQYGEAVCNATQYYLSRRLCDSILKLPDVIAGPLTIQRAIHRSGNYYYYETVKSGATALVFPLGNPWCP